MSVGGAVLLLFLWGSAAFLAIHALLDAAFQGSWSAARRSLARSVAWAAGIVAALAAIQFTCKGLGLGRWPPRDAHFAQRFHDRRADWLTVKDGVLREARATGSDLSRDIVDQLDPQQAGVNYVWKERFRELGVADARAAWDGRWLRLVLWEEDDPYVSVREKGLFFVDPGLEGEPELRLVARVAVEDLGDGWYVFEE